METTPKLSLRVWRFLWNLCCWLLVAAVPVLLLW